MRQYISSGRRNPSFYWMNICTMPSITQHSDGWKWWWVPSHFVFPLRLRSLARSLSFFRRSSLFRTHHRHSSSPSLHLSSTFVFHRRSRFRWVAQGAWTFFMEIVDVLCMVEVFFEGHWNSRWRKLRESSPHRCWGYPPGPWRPPVWPITVYWEGQNSQREGRGVVRTYSVCQHRRRRCLGVVDAELNRGVSLEVGVRVVWWSPENMERMGSSWKPWWVYRGCFITHVDHQGLQVEVQLFFSWLIDSSVEF